METVHAATVTSVVEVTPHMRRVALRLDEPAAWVSDGTPDECVHVEVGAETDDADGHSARHYTVSGHIDGGFEMEVFLHGDGPGATWARTVVPGDRTEVSDSKGYYKVPAAGAGVRVLVGDATALPAIARILAEAGADEVFHVVVELADLADVRELPTAAQATVEWRLGGNGVRASILKDALVALTDTHLDPGAGSYVWVACEAKDSRAIRTMLRREYGLPLTHIRIVGYWHKDLEHALRVWNEASEETKAEYMSLWRDDRSDEENWVELEPFLQKMGA
ncbi:siderophore-interacting protein [Demequina mangrovi]|uniref:NADPH-dependent ferric siderophore reductase, contains FAD-binding and SIP domains n=1 Tax=Demequina mangrovi TaxID=1043493 RepID=A0A1H7ALE3_9MICO|nr:siderophore-interacting protein [Demequina mangrovi]SEJ66409.1 NADPH-dependent ferric siderophore reductase, contains FAD-binding and SIP domains [Demequina mangrovi]